MMMNVFSKVISSVMMLLFVMILPYFVGVNLMPNNLKTKPQITAQASTSSEVLGISDERTEETSQTFNLLTPQNLLFAIGGFIAFSLFFSLIYRKLLI